MIQALLLMKLWHDKLKVMIDPTQFKELVTHWFDPKFQSTCDIKRSSRSKMHEPHVTRTKSFARLAHEVAINDNGVYPSRGEMYVKTRTRKDGSIVDDKAAEVVASLKAIASDSTSTSGDKDDFTNDDYLRVKGPEKRGMPSVKKSGDSSTDSQTIQQLKSVVNVMVNIIQEHIPNANISEVLNNMNIEVPGISSVPNNSHSVNQRSPLRSGTNNGNYFYVSNFSNVTSSSHSEIDYFLSSREIKAEYLIQHLLLVFHAIRICVKNKESDNIVEEISASEHNLDIHLTMIFLRFTMEHQEYNQFKQMEMENIVILHISES
ncbi:hypothetical protein OSB04_024244 [Centaurea solstitialis]|uniref:Uncharacterized protein n=1 Tax=Centaurea solstitialis TaxID=347529 RepID=A0AA38W0F7_9ASTR|nr:hypothetical protein OSB04_024244 [Centaurea solstitialis]